MKRLSSLTRVVVAVVLSTAIVSAWAVAQDRGAPLRRLAASGDLAAIQKLAPSKEIINSADSQGLTPLMIAAAVGKADVVAFLLKSGANTEATTTDWKATALMFAANFGRLQAATALIEAGANIKAVDKEGYTCVDYCILPTSGQTEADRDRSIAVGKYLNSNGAPPTKMKKDDGLSLLFGSNTEPDRLKKLMDGVMK